MTYSFDNTKLLDAGLYIGLDDTLYFNYLFIIKSVLWVIFFEESL